MTTVSLALVPIFLIILLGYSFKQLGFPGNEFWPPLEKVTYFVLFPCLLINNLTTTPLHHLKIAPLVTALISSILLVAGLLVMVRPWLPVGGPEFTSIFQGSVRFNSYVGIAVVVALKIPSGLTLTAVALAAMIPVINLLCVVILAHHASSGPTRWQNIVQALIRNPLILACVIGIFVNWTGFRLPVMLQQTLEIIGRAALPFGLLAVGAGLCFNAMTNGVRSLLISIVIKLLLFPLLTWLMCHIFQLDAQATMIAVLFTAVPTATSSYILARQMGGDYTLMANIITLQTVMAAVTLPLVVTGLTG
jgi:hypothetical protein